MTIRLALAGDAILTRDLREDPDADLLAVAELLRSADCAIANLELTLHDFTSPAAVAAGGMWLGAFPERAEDLAWLGVTAVSRANNHAGDYGVPAMVQTDQALAAAGIAHAGTGVDLGGAREPRYIQTPGGLVALVSCTATFPLAYLAGDARPPIPGRPGVNPLRRAGTRLIEPAEALARVGVPLPELRDAFPAGAAPEALTRPEGDPAPIAPQDREAVLAAVASARGQADAVVIAVHSHDQGATAHDPSPVISAFARDCIAAGADVVAVHGSHVVREVEMHRGRPILHGLGSLVFQPDGVPFLPADAYHLHGLGPQASVADVYDQRWAGGRRGLAAQPAAWEGLICVVTLDDGRAQVVAYPLDLRRTCRAGRRGAPRLRDVPPPRQQRRAGQAPDRRYPGGPGADRPDSPGLRLRP